MKEAKANKPFSVSGESISKDEVLPLLDYTVRRPIPGAEFSEVLTQVAVSKNSKKIEVDPLDVELQ